jgi:ankyrin repeat protein
MAEGADPNERDEYGDTLLHRARTPACVRVLLRYGADVNSVNKNGSTPLHFATNHECVQLLLEAGARANVRDHDGDTPLHRFFLSTRVIELLTAAGADPHLRNNHGNRPLDRFLKDSTKQEMLRGRMQYLQSQSSLRSACIFKLQATAGCSLTKLPPHIQNEVVGARALLSEIK